MVKVFWVGGGYGCGYVHEYLSYRSNQIALHRVTATDRTTLNDVSIIFETIYT